jgi:hypothetical protein
MQALRALSLISLSLLAFSLSVSAQTATGWPAVQALPRNTRVHVKADHHSSNCHITAVTENQLTCAEGVFSRSEIKRIQLIDKKKSTLAGLALGAGIGAGVGAGTGAAINAGDKGSLAHTSDSKATGTGAAVGVIIGSAVGTLVGYGANLFATTLYKR